MASGRPPKTGRDGDRRTLPVIVALRPRMERGIAAAASPREANGVLRTAPAAGTGVTSWRGLVKLSTSEGIIQRMVEEHENGRTRILG